MTTNIEHTDDALVGGRRRLAPRTFVKPSDPTALTEHDPPLLVEDLDPDPDNDVVDEPPEHPDEAENAALTCVYEAVTCQVSLGPDDDAFASTLALTGDDEEGDEVSVWLRLTPTLITRLTQQLTQVYQAQQESMGLPTADPLMALDDDLDHDQEDSEAEREGLIRRASDPLGVRFLRDRPAAVKWLAIAIGSLLVISLILRATVLG